MTTYRGQLIDYALHDRNADTYSLIGADGECLAELLAREFLSLPNRGNLEVRSGRYRTTGSKDQRGSARKPGRAGRDDALDALAFTFKPGTFTSTRQGSRPGLTLQDVAGIMLMSPLPRTVFSQSMLNSFIAMDEAARPPLKRDGVVAGEIIGYRCWRIQRGDPQALIGRLRSVYQSDVWNPGEVLQGRELGDWDSRGIHAWKDAGSKHYHDYIRSYLNRESDPFAGAFIWSDDRERVETRPAMVTGTVFLWGDVVEHERGYRAEFARVRSLDWLYPDAVMMGQEQKALAELRGLYGVADRNAT